MNVCGRSFVASFVAVYAIISIISVISVERHSFIVGYLVDMLDSLKTSSVASRSVPVFIKRLNTTSIGDACCVCH